MVVVDFEKRKQELLDECKLAPQIFDNVMPRLEKFMAPFVECFARSEQVEHAHTFVQGLLSDLEDKNVESIAYRFGQERMPLQWFVGMSEWDHEPLRDELVQQVAQTLGDEDGVLRHAEKSTRFGERTSGSFECGDCLPGYRLLQSTCCPLLQNSSIRVPVPGTRTW